MGPDLEMVEFSAAEGLKTKGMEHTFRHTLMLRGFSYLNRFGGICPLRCRMELE